MRLYKKGLCVKTITIITVTITITIIIVLFVISQNFLCIIEYEFSLVVLNPLTDEGRRWQPVMRGRHEGPLINEASKNRWGGRQLNSIQQSWNK